MDNVDLGIWKKLTRVVIFLLLIAYVMLVFAWYLPLIRQNENMRKRIQMLEDQSKAEEKISRDLWVEVNALRNDPQAIERLVREKLGYAKTNETIIRFESPSTNQPASRP